METNTLQKARLALRSGLRVACGHKTDRTAEGIEKLIDVKIEQVLEELKRS